MSTLLIQSGTLDDIADAIRAKTGGSSSMTPLEMPSEIASIVGGGGDITLLHSAGLTRSEIIDNPPTTYTFTENYDTIYVIGSISDNDAQAGTKITYNGNGTATEIDSKSGVYSTTDSINTKVVKIQNVSANESVEIARSGTDGLTGTWFIFSAVEQGGGEDIYSLNYVQENMKFWVDGKNNVNNSEPDAHEDSRFWATKYNNGGIYPGNLGSSPTWNDDNLEFTTRSTASYARFNSFDYANIRFPNALTVECYVEYKGSSSGNNECFSSCESGGWMISCINGVPDFKVRTSADSSVQPTGNAETLPLDEKHLLTGTYDKTTGEQKFYIDGVLKGTRTVTAGSTITNQNTVIWIGNDGNGGNPESSASNYAMIGKVYSARIYDAALTQAQIQQNYTVDVARFGGNS